MWKSAGCLVLFVPLFLALQRAGVSPSGEVLLLHFVHRDGALTLDGAMLSPGPWRPPPHAPAGRALEPALLSASGAVLWSEPWPDLRISFPGREVGPSGEEPPQLSLRLPWIEAARRLQVRDGEGALIIDAALPADFVERARDRHLAVRREASDQARRMLPVLPARPSSPIAPSEWSGADPADLRTRSAAEPESARAWLLQMQAGVIDASAAAQLAVRIVDPQGRPVAKAGLVAVEPTDGTPLGGAETGSDGRATLNLSAGKARLYVFPPYVSGLSPFSRKTVEIDLSAVGPALDVALDEGVLVSGNVSRAGGGGLSGCSVTAVVADSDESFEYARTDSGGNFTMRLPAGWYRFYVGPRSGLGLAVSGPQEVAGGAKSLDFSLSQELNQPLSVRVENAAGQPLAGARVTIYDAAANSLGSYTTPAGGGFSTTAPIEGFLYVRPNTATRYQAITRALTASGSVTLVLPEMGGITTPFPDRPQLGLIHGDPLDTSRINLVFVGDGYTDTEEPFTDLNGNGLWDGDTYLDENRNGRYDSGEQYYERNGIAGYQEPEPFQDLNGDGHRSSGEQGLLDRNALDYARVLLGTPPWPDMSERINMWRVRTISNQTAGSFPEFNIVRDTALRTSYGNKATGFIISVSNSAATQLVQTLLPEYDHIITISNSPVGVGRANANYGGNIRLRGGDFDNLSTVATHELGHAVGLLSDEYTDSTVIDSRYIYKGLEPGGPNTTANPNPGYTKWAAELDGTLPYPTPPDLAGTGIFEGAGTYFRGRYRPEYNCMMRFNTPRFCVICDREIRAQIIDRSSTGTGAFPLLVCRLDAAGSDRLTTAFSVLNPDGARKLPMALAATGGSGQLVIGRGVINPRDMSLLPRHQDASFEREHFGPLTPQESWVRVSSNGAYKGFYLISDPEFDVKMDGAVADPEASVDLAVPYVALDPSVRFRLSVVNPSTRSARAAVTYYDAHGTALQEEERSLPSRGQALFSPPAGQKGWIRVRSVASPPVMLQAAAYSYDSRRLAVQSGAALDVPTSLLTLPHYAIGAGYETRLVLVSASSVSLEITARRVDGSVAALPVTRTLGPMQQLDQSVRDLFGIDPGAGVAVGYITVADASMRPEALKGVTGLTYFTFRDNSAAVSPAERTAREVLTFSHVANEIPAGIATAFMTGLTLVNPSDRDARLKITVHDARGAVLGERDLVLPAKNKISRLLTGDPASSSFFPPGLAASSGYIIVTSDVPLFGFELFFTGDLTAMASVPAQ